MTYIVLDNQKALKTLPGHNIPSSRKFKDLHRNLRTFQDCANPVSIEEDDATSFPESLSRFLPREGMPVHDRFTLPSAVCQPR